MYDGSTAGCIEVYLAWVFAYMVNPLPTHFISTRSSIVSIDDGVIDVEPGFGVVKGHKASARNRHQSSQQQHDCEGRSTVKIDSPCT